MSRPRLLSRGHPDRPLSVEEVLEPAYQALVAKAVANGASEEEAALAIEGLAQAHLDTIAANKETEAEIAKARREAGLPEVVEAPPQPMGWMEAAGAAIWSVVIFSAGYLAFWLLMQLLRW